MSSPQDSKTTAAAEDESEKTAPLPVRRLLELARPEWVRLTLGTIALLIATGMGLLFPLAIGQVVDSALETSESEGTSALDRWALILAVVILLQSVFVFLRYYLFAIAGERIVCDLRGNAYEAILSQEVAFFDVEGTGTLQSRLSSDTSQIQSAVTDDLGALLTDLVRVLVGLAFLGWLSLDLTLWMLATVPPVAIGAVLFGKRIHKLSKKVQDALAKAGDVVQESVSSLRTVRSFGAETREVGRYRASIVKVFVVARELTIASSIYGGVTWLAGFGSLALVFWFGGRKVAAGEMSIGELIAFLFYTLSIASSFAGLASLWGSFMRAGGASKRVFEILDRTPLIPLEGGERPQHLRGEVRFEDVHFAYPTRKDSGILRGVNLELRQGEIVALVGPSGSGKSTISGLLLRLYDPTAGKIFFSDHDLRDFDPTWLRKSIGIVSQEPLLFTGSIEDNVRYGRPDATNEEVAAACTAAHMDEFTSDFDKGLATEVGERGVQLSGGQKQRVAIARAILKNPPLLILDEATSALDSLSEAAVQAALTDLVHTRTTLIIAHRESTIRDAQRVLVLRDGRVESAQPHRVD